MKKLKLLVSTSTSILVMGLTVSLSSAMDQPHDGMTHNDLLNPCEKAKQTWLSLIPENSHSVFEVIMPALLKLNSTDTSNVMTALSRLPEYQRAMLTPYMIMLFQGITRPAAPSSNGLFSILGEFRCMKYGFFIPKFKGIGDEIARCKILQFVNNRIPEKCQEEFSPLVVDFFEELAGAPDITYDQIFCCLFHMDQSEIMNIMDSVIPLLKYMIDKNEVPHILKMMSTVPNTERHNMIDCAIPFFKASHPKGEQYPILWRLQSIPRKRRIHLVDMVVPFSVGLEGYKCADIIACFENIITGKDTINPVKFLQAYIPPMTESLFKEKITNQWDAALKSSDTHKTKDVSDFILEHFRKFGFTEFDPIIQEAVKDRIQKTLFYIMQWSSTANQVCELVTTLFIEQQRDGNPTITLLFAEIETLVTRCDILRTLLKLPPEEHGDFVKNIVTLLQGLSDYGDIGSILDVLLWLPFEERSPFVDTFSPFVKDINTEDINTSVEDRGSILKALTWVPVKERANFAKFAWPVIRDISHGKMRADVLKTLALTTENKRTTAVPSVLKFFRYVSYSNTRICTLTALENISSEDIPGCMTILSDSLESSTHSFDGITQTAENCLVFLLSKNPLLKDSMAKSWHSDLLSDHKEMAIRVSEYILMHFEEFGFNLLDPIVQKAAQVRMAYGMPEQIQKVLAFIPIQEQSTVLPNLLHLFKGYIYPSVFSDILEIFAGTPPEERASLIQIAAPFIKDIKVNEAWPYVFRSLGLIPKNEREKVAPTIFDIIKAGSCTTWKKLVGFLTRIPVEERVRLIDRAMPLFKVMPCNKHNYPHILELLSLIPSEEHDKALNLFLELEKQDRTHFEKITYRNNVKQKCLAFLMTNDQNLKASIIKHWYGLLSSPDKERAKRIADLIVTNMELFALYESDEIVQEAILVGILLETSDDPLNPYNFFDQLKKRREEPIAIDLAKLPREILEGITLRLNPVYMKTLPQMVVTFKDLPKYSRDYLSKMQKQIETRLKDPLNTFDFTWK